MPTGEPPAKLTIKDLDRGTGAEAVPGKTLAVDYKGVRFDDGEPFDSSWSTGQPFQFILGARQVIKGWEQGLKGMRVGGRRELTIPPELAYGDHGQGRSAPTRRSSSSSTCSTCADQVSATEIDSISTGSSGKSERGSVMIAPILSDDVLAAGDLAQERVVGRELRRVRAR